MRCDAVRDAFDDYVANTLDAERAGAIADHLAECPACRSALALERLLRAESAAAPEVVVPAGFADAVMVEWVRESVPVTVPFRVALSDAFRTIFAEFRDDVRRALHFVAVLVAESVAAPTEWIAAFLRVAVTDIATTIQVHLD